ncbi:MAG TPA: aldolase/citrate lyase family protein [Casimicrobiaceae bacterium]|nr:aldolase/citrate lyase family protein [Casimicrobiaceae bacterium]
MKAKFAAGEPAFGLSVMIPSPQIVESAAGMGFDWVLIDCEHGTVGLESMELMVMAAEASGVTPIVRPRTNAAEDILQAMDRGAQGVQVPHVNTGAQARSVVEAVKFHPQGRRSLAAGTRASGYGFRGSVGNFVAQANLQSLVCIQIEDEEALPNLDDILRVEGVDVFFIGPSDLSQSMGFPGDPKAPPVARAIEAALRKIVAAGKTPGMPAAAAAVQAALASGVRYIYTHLPAVLASGASAYFQSAKPAG